MLDISLKQLEAFVATVHYQSFSKAAQELFLSQSTVSAHVAALEQILGRQLILRQNRKDICLSEDGQIVYDQACDILERCRALEDQNSLYKEQELLLGASTVPAQYILPLLLSGFSHKEKKCRYLVKKGDSLQIKNMLQGGVIRLAFTGMALRETQFLCRSLMKDKLVVITPNNRFYRQLAEKEYPGEELLDQPFIAREDSSGTQRSFIEYLGQIGYKPENLNIIAKVEQPETIKKSVTEGLGIAVMSQLAIKEEVAANKLLCFDIAPQGLYRNIYLSWLKHVELTWLEKAFVHFACQRATEIIEKND
ncbi:MAG: LysR family transcriptional regulator [Firmicutes bacterium]|nr:LysR family transcriptional regulator [Bacillota bacterium]